TKEVKFTYQRVKHGLPREVNATACSLTTSPDEPAADAAPGREQRRPPPGEQGEGSPIGSGRACDAVFELGAKPQSSKRILIPF
ncbi:hypothetical protein, partial [Bilophila wadsworthia]|uniref:hypothetical protein n=1 Tax=Bilophila wadsworthia TaxID=35833 RepID=UPI0024314FD9